MKIFFIGCGLIGGSIAKSLIGKAKIHILTTKPITYDGLTSYTNITEIPSTEFDIICISTPRGKYFEIYKQAFETAGNCSTKNTFIVDVSSVQNQNEIFQKKYSNFTPCHPIAGTEKSGFENSDPSIILNKNCIIISENPPKPVLDFWHSAGMKSISLPSVNKHDEIFAKISHLPQLISFNMTPKHEYKTFYRLCHSSQSIWSETFLHNKIQIQHALISLKQEIQKFQNSNLPLEKIISLAFLQICNNSDKSFAGTGFRSITSCEHIQEQSANGYSNVLSVIKNSEHFLTELSGF